MDGHGGLDMDTHANLDMDGCGRGRRGSKKSKHARQGKHAFPRWRQLPSLLRSSCSKWENIQLINLRNVSHEPIVMTEAIVRPLRSPDPTFGLSLGSTVPKVPSPGGLPLRYK